MLSVFASWVFINWGEQLYDKIPEYIVNKEFCSVHKCFDILSIYRISFGLAMFFAIQAVAMIGVSRTSDVRSTVQNGFWFFKLLFLVGLVTAAFFIPQGFYVYFAWLALVASVIFLFFQLVLLVDFAHSWTESWLEKYDEQEENIIWFRMLVGASVGLFLISAALIITMYSLFIRDAQCSLNTVFITIALLMSIFMTALALHPKIQERSPKSGLLQPAVVAFYMNYLVWSAIMSEPSDGPLAECNRLTAADGILSGGSQSVSMIMGVVLVITAVCYSALRTSSAHNELLGGPATGGEGTAAEYTALLTTDSIDKVADAAEGGKIQSSEDVQVQDEHVGYNYSFFHFIFCLAAMYICMLMTNWAVAGTSTPETDPMMPMMPPQQVFADRSMTSVWIKVASSWMVALLFIWSLVAPVVFPDRDFAGTG